MYYYINLVIEFIAFLIACIYLINKRTGWYRHFTWFLLVVVITENAGNAVYFYWHTNNHWVYNAYLPVEIFFKAWILYKICQPHFNSRPMVITGLAVFVVSYLIESLESGFRGYSAITNILFSIWVVVTCFLYYYYLLKEDSEIPIFKHPPFWIITGLFFFYFVSTASNLFFTYLVQVNKTKLVPIRYTIFLVIDLILYSTWSYAFIRRCKETISYSS